jgi:hypothetical protein
VWAKVISFVQIIHELNTYPTQIQQLINPTPRIPLLKIPFPLLQIPPLRGGEE